MASGITLNNDEKLDTYSSNVFILLQIKPN